MVDEPNLRLRQGVGKEGFDCGPSGADHGRIRVPIGFNGIELAVKPDGHGRAVPLEMAIEGVLQGGQEFLRRHRIWFQRFQSMPVISPFSGWK